MKNLKNATLPHNYSKEGRKWEKSKNLMLKQQHEL